MAEDSVAVWQLCLSWLERSAVVAGASAPALDAINVFPVSDADTGTNVELTLSGLAAAIADLDEPDTDSIVSAAVLSAHGNSGAILAQMVTSVCRAVDPRHIARAEQVSARGSGLALLLRTAATAATRAVARPVAGTILTVADAAADAGQAAAAESPDDALAVAAAARAGAADALRRTPEMLPVLAAAGVVDAGGQAYLLLLDVLVEVLGGPPAQPLTVPAVPTPQPGIGARSVRPAASLAYEVMYAVRGVDLESLEALRAELSELGDSVVVVGDRTVAQVHVHLGDAGAAVEAGLVRGQLSQVRITALPLDTQSDERAVVAVVAGPGIARAVEGLGALTLQPAGRHVTADEFAGLLSRTCGDLVVLPNDMEGLEIATHQASALRASGRRVAVVPTVAQIQGLAAMAVHEPAADFDSAVVAMSAAAGHVRHGAVTVAESPAMTMAGRCETGDVLGLVDGDFVEIGGSLQDVAWRVVERLLGFGGELLTVVTGADGGPDLVAALERRLRERGDPVDVDVIHGGQRRYPLLMGLE